MRIYQMSKFYTYLHIDPLYKQVVYVGKGVHGRAWDVTRCRGQHKEHQDWMLELCELGYTPEEWVKILHKNLTEDAAFKLEKEWLHNNGCPIYNRQSGEKQHQAKLTNQQARDAYLLAKMGMTHTEIAKEFRVSRTTITMIVSGRQWRATTSDLRAHFENKN